MGDRMKQQQPEHHSLAKLAAVQHLRSCGIKIKHWNSKQRSEANKGKVFGTSLHSLPYQYLPEYGNVPVILVIACNYLEKHISTEGLFRKSGSVVRQKQLKAKLENGENCLSTALPCDVAGILKQFFRELPEPLLPTDLQDAFYKAQSLSTDSERISATMLITCLIPEKNVHVLRYFFSFLHAVALRCDANKMNSSNLAVIFAPNLLQSNDDGEKISPSTEKRLRVQAAVVQMLIDQAANIGCVPDFILEKIPGMLGVDLDTDTPLPEASEDDGVSPGEKKRRRRRSMGEYVSGALHKLKTNRTPTSTPQTDRSVLSSMVTPLILTPNSKRKLPVESVQGISTKKRKSMKHNLNFELLPSSLFGGGSTPASALYDGSPCLSLDNSQSSFSPSVSTTKHLSSTGNLRRSKRYESRKVQRVDSGKTGCFSPKISRTEMVRRSLRLRFSLGKSSKDSSSVFPSTVRSQNIGWRLANSQDLNLLRENDKVDAPPFPGKSPFVSSGSTKISKSEENLLTPKSPKGSCHRMSWTGSQPLVSSEIGSEGTPLSGYFCAANCYSEPVLVTKKPPAMPIVPQSLVNHYKQDTNVKDVSLNEEDQNSAQNTALQISKAFTESGSDLRLLVGFGEPPEKAILLDEAPISELLMEPMERKGTDKDGDLYSDGEHAHVPEQEIVLVQNEYAGSERKAFDSPPKHMDENDLTEEQPERLFITEEENTVKQNVSEDQSCGNDCKQTLEICRSRSESASTLTAEMSSVLPPSSCEIFPLSEQNLKIEGYSETHHAVSTTRKPSRVSEHIQHFNKLCLNDGSVNQKPKSPLKFQRPPVRQSVRRINSLSDMKRPANCVSTIPNLGSPIVKSISYDGSLSSDQLMNDPKISFISALGQEAHGPQAGSFIPEERNRFSNQSLRNVPCTVKAVLEDLTNQDISRLQSKKSTPNNVGLRSLSRRDCSHYRGSPRNPIAKVSFLPSSKPWDL
ncbi:rho GTPase activating protein 11A, gene 1 L homeolog isoform X2 [Xenopus laevis]|uniref:Rho GTPase activating protein 11A, gene 1 L homeolog isoform X2 n=1 Tax=Xenopus laevis TaxID=8355 RepID=A0A8J0THK7_XENLA|nr:rho GTPase activating protein 11A, gene 1 L homeolog isoform X2 [Xenopus laevis]